MDCGSLPCSRGHVWCSGGGFAPCYQMPKPAGNNGGSWSGCYWSNLIDLDRVLEWLFLVILDSPRHASGQPDDASDTCIQHST
jgi:hypothetical protein